MLHSAVAFVTCATYVKMRPFLAFALGVFLTSCVVLARETKSACEDETLVIACPSAYVIHILGATYGRKKYTYDCHPPADIAGAINALTQCQSYGNTKDIVSSRCDDKSSCSVEASNSVFGDPCGRVIKKLEVDFECACIDGRYGSDCKHMCGQCLDGEPCDKNNGSCRSCLADKVPPLCQKGR